MNPALLHNDVVHWLLAVGGILLVDISLSGDNALVIGSVASRLSGRRRTLALIWGGAAAAVLRIVLTAIASELLLIPLVQSIGAVVILYIAITMLLPEKDEEGEGARRRSSDRLFPAILAISLADLTMSLDNVLAIGALARGNLPALIFGLAVSIVLLLLASALIAHIIERFWWLMDLAALLLGYLASQLVLSDPIVSRLAGLTGWRATAVEVGAVTFVLLVAIVLRIRQTRDARKRAMRNTESSVPSHDQEMAS